MQPGGDALCKASSKSSLLSHKDPSMNILSCFTSHAFLTTNKKKMSASDDTHSNSHFSACGCTCVYVCVCLHSKVGHTHAGTPCGMTSSSAMISLPRHYYCTCKWKHPNGHDSHSNHIWPTSIHINKIAFIHSRGFSPQ